uniref:Late embryogenesis abundant protein LEA-2 subgroup domain-containing protein n=1 Tax=Petunia integrifolia subsp. inflata TaxID=212142 RepID=Q6PUQ1_PETIN|nr:unknown pollen protein [Petunia integrifolia subsp. inflata]
MHPHPPPYVMVENGRQPPPPYHSRKAPRYGGEYYYEERPRRGNCCIRCICCCYCVLFFIIVLLGAFAFYFYTMYQPKLPTYKFQSLEVKEFGYQPDFSLTTDIIVTIRAENPNKAISLIYGKESSVNVTYTDSTICSGTLPSFHQGHKNVTMMQIELKGKSQFGSGLYEAMQDNEKNGKIPLLVKLKVPVQVYVGEYPLRQFNVLANCSLVVDNLKPGKKVEIIKNDVTFKLAP